MERHYIVVTSGNVRVLREAIRASGGVVLMLLPSGALIVQMREETKEQISGRPDVAHCGGVEIAPRAIRRIRVDPTGRQVTHQRAEEGDYG